VFPAIPILTLTSAAQLDRLLPPQIPGFGLLLTCQDEGKRSIETGRGRLTQEKTGFVHKSNTLHAFKYVARFMCSCVHCQSVCVLIEYHGISFTSFGLAALLISSTVLTGIFALAAYHNYPGGIALHRLLHHHIPSALSSGQLSVITTPVVFVHVDVFPAMTGVTR
jgi:hypothetical protein